MRRALCHLSSVFCFYARSFTHIWEVSFTYKGGCNVYPVEHEVYSTGACPARPVAPEDGTGVKCRSDFTGVEFCHSTGAKHID